MKNIEFFRNYYVIWGSIFIDESLECLPVHYVEPNLQPILVCTY